ncbi:MAG: amidophosphoribosyltransferase [Alphaproteobacteria bacterium]
MNKQRHPFDDDKLHEECGVFGVFGHDDAAALTVLGMHALQHRGQEAAGIVTFDGRRFHSARRAGLVGDHFTKPKLVEKLRGDRAIGHVRYSTHGAPAERNIQPMFAEFASGGFAVAHNGNLTNALTLKSELQRRGSIFQSTTDTELILHLIATSIRATLVERTVEALHKIVGAYSLVCLSNKKLIGCRDPRGVRPLVLGKLDGAWVLASETCALDIIGATFVRDIEPGELVVITEDGVESSRPFAVEKSRFCIFEYVYFARPDSAVEGRNVYQIRKRIGAELAREQPADADLVIPVPDSGTPAAMGYAEASGLPFELGVIRNHYVGRTFIEPNDAIRNMGVRLKHNANRDILEGKRVVMVDDSIVRGTTSLKIVQMIREAGASEVHMRIASPPTMHPCFYGVDTPEKDKLIASRMPVADIADLIKADSLGYLSIDGLYRATGAEGRVNEAPQYCDACFTGDYPTRLEDRDNRDSVRGQPLLAEAQN